MAENSTPSTNSQETKNLDDDFLKELSDLRKSDLTHLEDEFKNYKVLYPKNTTEEI